MSPVEKMEINTIDKLKMVNKINKIYKNWIRFLTIAASCSLHYVSLKPFHLYPLGGNSTGVGKPTTVMSPCLLKNTFVFVVNINDINKNNLILKMK